MPFRLWTWMVPRNRGRWRSRCAEGCCHGNQCSLSLGYNFGCIIASDALFDSRVGFQGQAIRWRHSQFRGSKERCQGNQFWDVGATYWIRLNRPCAAVMRPYVILLWPLVVECRTLANCDWLQAVTWQWSVASFLAWLAGFAGVINCDAAFALLSCLRPVLADAQTLPAALLLCCIQQKLVFHQKVRVLSLPMGM